jgi:hypothetical protein
MGLVQFVSKLLALSFSCRFRCPICLLVRQCSEEEVCCKVVMKETLEDMARKHTWPHGKAFFQCIVEVVGKEDVSLADQGQGRLRLRGCSTHKGG